MLRTASSIVRGLNVLNWIFAGVFVLALALTFAAEPRVAAAIARGFPDAQAGALMRDLRLVLVIGIAGFLPARILFVRLSAILRSVETGDAFVAENGIRLRQIGWALLALQIIDLAYGWVALSVSTATDEYLGWSFSFAGWLSVLLVFVLARVWTQGAGMRDDLEGTV